MPEIQLIPIKSLTLLDRNPRKISKEQFAKLCKSLTDDPDFFHNRPALVNMTNAEYKVYAGNQRILAAKKLKWKEVPCIIDVDLGEDIIAQRIIKDNAHYGSWDDDILSADYDMNILLDSGFEKSYFDGFDNIESFTPPKDADEVLEEQKKAKMCACPECGHEFTRA
jgi:hypothetical protein